MTRVFFALLVFLISIPAVAESDPSARAAAIGQDILGLRDPFRRPSIATGETVPLSDLEMYPIHSFSLLGVMTGPTRIRGMVKGPDGKTHFVSESDKIGNKKGFIKEIKPDGLVVQEQVVNVLGEEEITLTEMKIIDKESK